MGSSTMLTFIAALGTFYMAEASAASTDAAFCKDLGYCTKLTDSSTKETISKNPIFLSLQLLDKIGCSKLSQHFTCSIFYPPTVSLYGAVPPCRSVCTSMTQSCSFFMSFAANFSPFLKGMRI